MKIVIPFLLTTIMVVSMATGQTWQQLPMHGGGYVTGLIHHPSQANTLFARIDVGGIYKSTDGGDSWVSLTKDIIKDNKRNYQVRSLVVDGGDPQRMYFVSGNSPYSDDAAFWQSSDGGGTWNKHPIPFKISGNQLARYGGETMCLSPSDPNLLFVAGQPSYNWGTTAWNGNGGFYSYDINGQIWTKLGAGLFDNTWITGIRFHPSDPDLIYLSAMTHDQWGPATTNAGLWQYRISSGTLTSLLAQDVLDFAFDAASANTIVTTGSAGISWTNDAGSTWTTPTQPHGFAYNYFVSTHPSQSGVWYFGYWEGFNANGILYSPDGGVNFHEVDYNSSTNRTRIIHPPYLDNNQRPGFGNAPATLIFSPVNSTIAYISDWYGVWRTSDASAPLVPDTSLPVNENADWTWTYKTEGIHNLVNLRVSKRADGRFYCNVADVGFYYSDDEGGTMHHLSSFPVTSVYQMRFQGDTGYCVGKHHTSKGKIMKSTDGGETWFEAVSGWQYGTSYFEQNNSACITDLQLAGSSADSLIVGIQRGAMANQIYRSDDGGLTYYPWDTGIPTDVFKVWDPLDRLIKDADNWTFYVHYQNTIYRRHISEPAWTLLPHPSDPAYWFHQVIAHPEQSGTLYASQYSTLYKSTDYGDTWTALPDNGINSRAIAIIGNRLAVVDGEDEAISKPQNIYFTDDDGANWAEIGMDGYYSMINGIEFISPTRLVGWSENTGAAVADLSPILPVELLTFTGRCEGDDVVLEWATASEYGHWGWDIEASEKGYVFQKIDFLEGQGNSNSFQNYSFYHQNNPNKKYNYYRLKQIDNDGSFSYSPIIKVEPCGDKRHTFSIKKTDGLLQVEHLNGSGQAWSTKAYGINGTLLYQSPSTQQSSMTLDFPTQGGMVIIHLYSDGEIWTQMVFY